MYLSAYSILNKKTKHLNIKKTSVFGIVFIYLFIESFSTIWLVTW